VITLRAAPNWGGCMSARGTDRIHPLEWVMPVIMTAAGLVSIVLMVVAWF
jgi:hypothetical protein